MKIFTLGATLEKSATIAYEVGGIASSFHRDLDGEAITPQAVEAAIADFMASRGADGIQGGPLRLHHDFWSVFLKRAIAQLNLPTDKQFELVAAISLPLGRVTKIWVDHEGVTHWRGVLSMANPIARIIWDLLKEGLIHLGVSLGGKIFETQRNGRDALGRPCTLITKIRIDELSITDNPALRLTHDEGTGAYISALAKSIHTVMSEDKTVRFLHKAIGGNAGKEINSGDYGGNKTGLARRGVGEPQSVTPKGRSTIKMDSSTTTTGMGGTAKAPAKPAASHAEPPTDVYGFTLEGFVKDLQKSCQDCDREKMQSPAMLKKFGDGVVALANMTESPPPALINMMKYLHMCSQFCQSLPSMDDYQAAGTVSAMGSDLTKALEDFLEDIPTPLKQQRFRPPGAAGIAALQVSFPQQYIQY